MGDEFVFRAVQIAIGAVAGPLNVKLLSSSPFSPQCQADEADDVEAGRPAWRCGDGQMPAPAVGVQASERRRGERRLSA
jgi:hypothetical protein